MDRRWNVWLTQRASTEGARLLGLGVNILPSSVSLTAMTNSRLTSIPIHMDPATSCTAGSNAWFINGRIADGESIAGLCMSSAPPFDEVLRR